MFPSHDTAINNKVSTSSSDPSTGFLLQKLITTSLPELALTINENTTNPASYQAQISPVVNWYAFAEKNIINYYQ